MSLQSWTAAACSELGIDEAAVDVRMILDLARDAAHAVERPAAPVTAFLLGLAVGRGQAADEVAGRLQALARDWPEAPVTPVTTVTPEAPQAPGEA
jgi:Domain of unknown function (DUF6457)